MGTTENLKHSIELEFCETENADICLKSAKEIDAENAEAYINDLLKN